MTLQSYLKTKTLRLPLIVAGLLALGACSSENIDVPDDNGAKPGGDVSSVEGYLAFRLEDPEMGTRDTHKEYDDDYERFEWFNKGTADERAIVNKSECNRVFFFNEDFSFYGAGKLGKPSIETESSNIYVARQPGSSNVTPVYAAVVMNGDPDRLNVLESILSVAEGDAVNAFMTYLNEVDTDDPESLAMCKDDEGKKYFTMTSTVYVGDEDTNPGKIMALQTLKAPVFYKTEKEALENLTTFTVERILSKFTLIIKDGNFRFGERKEMPILFEGPDKMKVRINYAPEGQEVKDIDTPWKANLVNWGVNGLEKNTYLMKVLANPDEVSEPYPWTIWDNFYIGWNSPQLMRSYWGIDENYYGGFYPDQYRQALDVAGVKPATTNNIYSNDYDGTLSKDDYTLIYKPYNAYKDRENDKYSVENTFDPGVIANQDINSQPWLRSGTHIILTAQLIFDEIEDQFVGPMTNIDESGFISGIKDKYFSNGLWWLRDALLQQAVSTLMTNIYYNKNNIGDKDYRIPNVLRPGEYVEFINKGTDGQILDTDMPVYVLKDGVDSDLVEFNHENLAEFAGKYFTFDKAFIKGGDGWVTLKKQDNVHIYANYIDGSKPEISDEQLVSYIYRFTNLAKHYTEGRMYYAIPIRHNLNSQSYEEDPVTEIRTGDYGVVRNTWYRMTLNSVLKPGTPVDDPDQPIIPNPEPDDKSLGVEVEIIPWRTVDIKVDQLH